VSLTLNSLAQWLPEAERFTAQVKGTQEYINQLVDTSSTLAKKLSEKEERFTELSMDATYMRHSLKAQERLLDRIPPEVMEEIKRAKGKEKWHGDVGGLRIAYGGKYSPYAVCGIFAMVVHIVRTRNGKLSQRSSA